MAVSFWLHDVSSSFSFTFILEILPELWVLAWQQPCHGKEVIFFPVRLLHRHKVESQQIFPCEHMYARVVVDLLVKAHPVEDIWVNHSVCPPHIPTCFICPSLNLPLELLGHFTHNWVLSIFLSSCLPETFITIRFKFTLFPFGSPTTCFLGFLVFLTLCTFSSSSELHCDSVIYVSAYILIIIFYLITTSTTSRYSSNNKYFATSYGGQSKSLNIFGEIISIKTAIVRACYSFYSAWASKPVC